MQWFLQNKPRNLNRHNKTNTAVAAFVTFFRTERYNVRRKFHQLKKLTSHVCLDSKSNEYCLMIPRTDGKCQTEYSDLDCILSLKNKGDLFGSSIYLIQVLTGIMFFFK